ncbi:MAG TPA: DUF1329 domain-containing protein [Steroidobacteraceae bacterium]|nr:DUF1329 domain-containing protein [Steroidobacteraceae bacterium]
MKVARIAALALVVAALAPSTAALAAVSAQEAARLGADLTPLGGEKAGNAAGTIPAWDGGLSSPAKAGFPNFAQPGRAPDPFPNDKPLFKITAANMAQYADRLTEGQKAMLRQYKDTYYLNVYQTRRTAASPQRIYDAAKRNATNARLIEGGNGFTGAVEAIPFPIPTQGVEAIWNHIVRYRGDSVSRETGQAAVTESGSFNMVKFHDEVYFAYMQPGATEATLDNVVLYFLQEILAPARLAGQVLLVHETLDQSKENRRAWIYFPGQRRVQRAPNVAFDNPGTASDGLRTDDQFDVYNGSPQRYDWKIVGKKEMFVPYNSYKLHWAKVKAEDVLKPLHINQEYPRYELHRVWVVEATLKAGQRHIYKRRTMYLDEDSWQILAVDCYDNRDQLWRVQEGQAINYYNVPALWTTLDLTYDLQSRRYLALGMEDQANHSYEFNIKRSLRDYTTLALQNRGTR